MKCFKMFLQILLFFVLVGAGVILTGGALMFAAIAIQRTLGLPEIAGFFIFLSLALVGAAGVIAYVECRDGN